MGLSSLYVKLERCKNNLEYVKMDLKKLELELEESKENKTKYEKQKKSFFDTLAEEKKNVNQLYNLAGKNKLSAKLYEVMNDTVNGREASISRDSAETLSRVIDEVINDLMEKIQEKKEEIKSLNIEIFNIKEEIRKEKEREKHKNKVV